MASIVGSSRSKTMHIDIPEKDLKGIEMGAEMTVVVKGTVRSISMPYEYENEDGKIEKEDTGDLSLKITGLEIEDGSNVFEQIAKEEM